ncbi:hypothetical protein NE237_012049 [Protea cynaroides]|uniref:Transmembrane protein n=1 Tax=Protea cynaroides TaxID=273540 RepID=A0A9Q0GW33_9MAGN|nr:hypothetical protein NE237_012049 [Protea cynaroides]
MGWERWKAGGRELLQTPFLREPFYIITISLLSLILPLSFLLLARLANAHYILSFTSQPYPPPFLSIFPLSFFLSANPTLLHFLVSIVSVTALLRALMGRFDFRKQSNSNCSKTSTTTTSKAHLYAAWIFLCTFDICVVLGIEGSLASGFWFLDLETIIRGRGTNLMSRVVFFIGLHETMLHWSRTTVRPVVDDTVLGVVREERWVERVAMAASFGGLWWWGLRKEVETLVVILEVKRDLMINVELADLVNCWLYYLIVTIGLVRLVRGLVKLVVIIMRCIRFRRSSGGSGVGDVYDSKV